MCLRHPTISQVDIHGAQAQVVLIPLLSAAIFSVDSLRAHLMLLQDTTQIVAFHHAPAPIFTLPPEILAIILLLLVQLYQEYSLSESWEERVKLTSVCKNGETPL